MSFRHLVTRARKRLKFNSNRKRAIKDHLQQFKSCSKSETDLYSSFTVLKKCSSEYNAKIHEALLIKQSKPLLNKQPYANVCSFLLKYFNLLVLFRHNLSIYCICYYIVKLFVIIFLFRHNP